MIILAIVATMLLLASGFICFRLWFPEQNNQAAKQSGEQMNKVLYREYVADLERQYSSTNTATVTKTAEKQALLLEAQRQLLADEQALIEQDVQQEFAAGKRGGGILLSVTLLLMLLALVLYARLGALPDVQIRNLLENSGAANSAELRDALSRRLEQRQDNFYYWLLLARVELSEQRLAQAVQAYQRARLLAPENAAVAAELAQALFGAAGNRVDDEVEALVIEALKNDANNTIALELAGIVAFSRQDYASAVKHWQRGLRFLRPDSANAQALQAGIAKAQSLMNKQPSDNALATNNDNAGHETEDQASEAVLLNLRVRLAEELKESGPINPASTVYVYVREWQGPPMPLVAQRFTVQDLPIEVNFSDAMSLAPARQLSSVDQLEVIVRVSLGGSLQASAGDLEGRLGPLSLDNDPAKKKGSAELGSSYELVIDRRLP